MRRSSKREAKRKRRNLIMGLSMVFLMVFSILAFAIDYSFFGRSSFEYNGFVFSEKIVFDDLIFFQDIVRYSSVISGEEVYFFFPPNLMSAVVDSTENISMLKDASSVSFSRSPLVEGEESNLNSLFFDFIFFEFSRHSFKSSRRGVLYHTIFDSDLSIISCNDANSSSFVFILSEEISQDPSISEISPFCFEIKGSNEGLLYISDYLLYKSHGVI